MEKNWYRQTLEALGRTGRRDTIRNRLNEAAAGSDDPVLRELIGRVLVEFDRSSTHTSHSSINDCRTGVPSAIALRQHCEARR